MKWIFLAGLFILVILLSSFLRADKRYLPHAAFALAVVPFLEARFHLTSAPVSWAGWAGPVQGIEISLADAIALAVIMAVPRVRSPLSLKLAMVLIIIAYSVSTIASGVERETLFVGWEIARTVLIYLAVTRVCVADKDAGLWLMNGLITGLVIQAVVVVIQYVSGDSQAPGWFGHQNLLGFVSHFIVFPAFAAFLGGYYRKRMLLAVAAGVVIAFGGASRATIGLTLAGMFLTVVFSSWHRVSGRKMALVIAAVIGMAALSPVLYSALQRRSVEQREDSSKVRGLMESAARMIISDYPLGIGANRYVQVANLQGYSERAGVPWDKGNRGAPVHNTYYLIATEMGWLGLLALVWLFASSIWVSILDLRKAPSFGGELSAGIAVSMLIVAVHCYFEWIFMIRDGHVFFAMALGLVAAVNAALRRPARDMVWPSLLAAEKSPA